MVSQIAFTLNCYPHCSDTTIMSFFSWCDNDSCLLFQFLKEKPIHYSWDISQGQCSSENPYFLKDIENSVGKLI